MGLIGGNQAVAEGLGSAKLLLFGEHAAVYGHPAVGVAIPGQTAVSLDLSQGQDWTFSGVLDSDVSKIVSLLELVERFFPALMRRGKGMICVKSTIPRGVGFGSSAALCVAFVMAGLSVLGGRIRYPFRRSLWRLSNQAERVYHGTPSGIDTGLSLLGGMHAFYPAPLRLPVARKLDSPPLYMVIGAVPRQKDTRSLVAEIAGRVRRGEIHVIRAMAHLGRLSREAVTILTSRDPDGLFALGRLASEAQSVLRELGLSSEELEDLIQAGIDAGAEGGKLSGAGGGGAFFLLARSRDRAGYVAEQVRSRAVQMGLPTVDTIIPISWTGDKTRTIG